MTKNGEGLVLDKNIRGVDMQWESYPQFYLSSKSKRDKTLYILLQIKILTQLKYWCGELQDRRLDPLFSPGELLLDSESKEFSGTGRGSEDVRKDIYVKTSSI